MSDFSDDGTSFIHESFHKDNASYFTREWFAVCLADAVKQDGNLVIPAAVAIPSAWEAGRYRLLAKLLLDVPGKGKHPGRLKNYLADRVCGSGDVLIVVPDYASVWVQDLEEYQIHAKFVLLDTVTGYRSQELEYSTCLRATVGIPTAGR